MILESFDCLASHLRIFSNHFNVLEVTHSFPTVTSLALCQQCFSKSWGKTDTYSKSATETKANVFSLMTIESINENI